MKSICISLNIYFVRSGQVTQMLKPELATGVPASVLRLHLAGHTVCTVLAVIKMDLLGVLGKDFFHWH